jgi:hypothetical protein
MSPKSEQRRTVRVEFSKGIDVQMMAIDGTWRRACVMLDASDGGAKLAVTESIQGLHLKEFFLLLSSMGVAFRRCELAWVHNDQIGVRFIQNRGRPKKKDSQEN